MASYWRELTDCESDKELVRAGLAYYTTSVVDNLPCTDFICPAKDWTECIGDWEYAMAYRRLWVLVEKDDSPNEE